MGLPRGNILRDNMWPVCILAQPGQNLEDGRGKNAARSSPFLMGRQDRGKGFGESVRD